MAIAAAPFVHDVNPMKLKSQRMRSDLLGRLMPVQTLQLILSEHKRNPWQRLYLFGWRGYSNKLCIYDMDLPWRKGMTDDTIKGWSESDWWTHSQVVNVPEDYMMPFAMAKKDEIIRAGYKNTIIELLTSGSVVPSKCLDDWLMDDSRKFCDPWLRMSYKDN